MSFITGIKHYPSFKMHWRKGRAMIVCNGCTARKSTHSRWVHWMMKHEACERR